MKRITAIMVGIAVILFIFIVAGYGLKYSGLNSIPTDQENWQFGDWENGDKEERVEYNAPKPNPEQPVHPEQKGQIIANTYDEAIAMAKEKNMPVLMFFHADWCHWCRKMEKEVLVEENVKTAMENYIFFKSDTDKEKEIAKKYHVRGLPSFVIIDSKEKVRKKEAGYKKPQEFAKFLNDEYKHIQK